MRETSLLFCRIALWGCFGGRILAQFPLQPLSCQFIIFTKTIMHLVYPPKFCITIVSIFSWVLQSSQEKSKTIVMHDNSYFWGGRQGALWSMWKCWIKEAIMSQKHSHSAVRHNSDRVSRATLNWLKGSSFLGVSLLSAWGETINIQREATSLAVSVSEEVRYKNNNYGSRLKWSWMLKEELYIIDDVLNGGGNVLTGSRREEQCWLRKKLNFWMNVH